MNTKKTIKQGLGLAAGVFVGNAAIAPMLFDGEFGRGILVGFISAALVLVVFSIIAVCQSDKPCKTEKKS